jgi:hypothetical protein
LPGAAKGEEHPVLPPAEERARGMIEEGADRQWRAEGKRIPFVLNPSHGEPTYSGEAGRPSSPAGE